MDTAPTLMLETPKPPTDDKRWRIVEAVMRRHGFRRDAVIETLHSVQETFGFLDLPALAFVAGSLRVPPSTVYGVATFYHFFSMKPPGKHTCVVCLGTACYIKGSPALLEAIGNAAGIKPGETTPDGSLSLLTARCLGSCGLAPAAVLDNEVAGKLDAAALLGRVKGWLAA